MYVCMCVDYRVCVECSLLYVCVNTCGQVLQSSLTTGTLDREGLVVCLLFLTAMMMMAFVCSEVLVGIVRFQKRYLLCACGKKKEQRALRRFLSFFTSS